MDKRSLRKLAVSLPKTQEYDYCYFTIASINRKRYLLIHCVENHFCKVTIFVNKKNYELLVLNRENNRWYKKIPGFVSKKNFIHLNVKAARKYFSVIDEKINMIQYICHYIEYYQQQFSLQKSKEEEKLYNKLFSSLKIQKGAYSFGGKSLDKYMLYSNRDVYCLKCKKWHRADKRPINGKKYVCPNCAKKSIAKPLVSTLEKEKTYFYVLQKHKGMIFILHCRYSRFMNKTTKVFSEEIFPFWIDVFDPKTKKLKKFKYDYYSNSYTKGRSMRFSTWKTDPRFEPMPVYTKNIKSVISKTFLENSGLEMICGSVFLEKVICACFKYPSEFEYLLKNKYINLLTQCSQNFELLSKVRKIPLKYLTLDNSLYLCDYKAISETNGKITPSDCKNRLCNYASMRSFISCVILANAKGSKVIEYISSKNNKISGHSDYSDNFQYYNDYLQAVCDVLGKKTVPKGLKYPKNLTQAHDDYIAKRKLINNKELNVKIIKAMSHFPKIVSFNNYNFCIAHSYEFLINEGNVLKHCVGGKNYALKIIRGESIIVSMRKNISKPLYTIEVGLVKTKPTIIQIYGLKNDLPPDKERIIAEEFVRKQLFKTVA